MRGYLVGLVAILGAWSGCSGEAEKIPTRFLVGYAEVEVTPPVGTIMGGYGPPGGFRRASGTHDPLLAQIAVIANDADQAFVIVAFDAVGFFYDFADWGPGVDSLRREMVKALGGKVRLKPEHIMLGSSHTHSGPDLVGFWQQTDQGPDRDLLAKLVTDITAAAKQAAAALQPATPHFGTTELVGYSGNSKNWSDILDNSVAIVQARDAAGTPLFTIANYAKHPTIIGSGNTLWSADFIWGLREELTARTGAPALYLQGGNAAVHGGPLGPAGDTDFDQAYDMGRILADAVEAALPNLEPSQSFQIRHRVATTECEIRSELVKAVRENMHIPPRRMRSDGDRLFVDALEVGWHQVGSAEFAVMPGEATPALSLAAKSRMVSPHRFFVGLGNDEIGYLIDKESIAQDTTGQLEGYELTMGPGADGGACVWAATESLGWFDGATVVP